MDNSFGETKYNYYDKNIATQSEASHRTRCDKNINWGYHHLLWNRNTKHRADGRVYSVAYGSWDATAKAYGLHWKTSGTRLWAFLLMGLFTRLSTIPLMITMCVVNFIMLDGSILTQPFYLLLLFACFFFIGSGKLSVDFILSGYRSSQKEEIA